MHVVQDRTSEAVLCKRGPQAVACLHTAAADPPRDGSVKPHLVQHPGMASRVPKGIHLPPDLWGVEIAEQGPQEQMAERVLVDSIPSMWMLASSFWHHPPFIKLNWPAWISFISASRSCGRPTLDVSHRSR